MTDSALSITSLDPVSAISVNHTASDSVSVQPADFTSGSSTIPSRGICRSRGKNR
jgi:hypothetical protein